MNAELFWSKVDRGESAACWPWRACIDRYGYGSVRIGGRHGSTRGAHRVAYELAKGEVPSGLVLDHLCRNRACCNPDHLEPVSNRVNILRGISPAAVNVARDRCSNGHPFDEANTYMLRGKRGCRACNRDAVARYRARKAQP